MLLNKIKFNARTLLLIVNRLLKYYYFINDTVSNHFSAVIISILQFVIITCTGVCHYYLLPAVDSAHVGNAGRSAPPQLGMGARRRASGAEA